MSGTRTDRPQYQRMLAAAKLKQFDVLLIEALDRFARNLVEQETAIRRMEFDGIRIILIIRDLVGGKIELKPTAEGLVARSALHKNVLVRACSPDGSGGSVCAGLHAAALAVLVQRTKAL